MKNAVQSVGCTATSNFKPIRTSRRTTRRCWFPSNRLRTGTFRDGTATLPSSTISFVILLISLLLRRPFIQIGGPNTRSGPHCEPSYQKALAPCLPCLRECDRFRIVQRFELIVPLPLNLGTGSSNELTSIHLSNSGKHFRVLIMSVN